MLSKLILVLSFAIFLSHSSPVDRKLFRKLVNDEQFFEYYKQFGKVSAEDSGEGFTSFVLSTLKNFKIWVNKLEDHTSDEYKLQVTSQDGNPQISSNNEVLLNQYLSTLYEPNVQLVQSSPICTCKTDNVVSVVKKPMVQVTGPPTPVIYNRNAVIATTTTTRPPLQGSTVSYEINPDAIHDKSVVDHDLEWVTGTPLVEKKPPSNSYVSPKYENPSRNTLNLVPSSAEHTTTPPSASTFINRHPSPIIYNSESTTNYPVDPKLEKTQSDNAKYSFRTVVDDNIEGNYQKHEEERKDGVVRGMFEYDDGNIFRSEHYMADKDGYHVIKSEITPSRKKAAGRSGEATVEMKNDNMDVAYRVGTNA